MLHVVNLYHLTLRYSFTILVLNTLLDGFYWIKNIIKADGNLMSLTKVAGNLGSLVRNSLYIGLMVSLYRGYLVLYLAA